MIEVVSLCKSDCCWVEVSLATLTCWGGYYQILNIGVSVSRLSFKMSTRQEHPREWCLFSAMSFLEEIASFFS